MTAGPRLSVGVAFSAATNSWHVYIVVSMCLFRFCFSPPNAIIPQTMFALCFFSRPGVEHPTGRLSVQHEISRIPTVFWHHYSVASATNPSILQVPYLVSRDRPSRANYANRLPSIQLEVLRYEINPRVEMIFFCDFVFLIINGKFGRVVKCKSGFDPNRQPKPKPKQPTCKSSQVGMRTKINKRGETLH